MKHNSLIETIYPYPNIPPLCLTPDEKLQAKHVGVHIHISSKTVPPKTRMIAHPVRNMSPKALARLAFDLYMEGELKRDEYLLLGFPSETHPHYNRTIGALTGEFARPDMPRDLIREWEAHLQKATSLCLPLTTIKSRAQKMLSLLRWLEHPSLGKTDTLEEPVMFGKMTISRN